MKAMNNLISVLKTSAIMLAAFMPLGACVHEYPGEGKEIDPTEIDLTIRLETTPSITETSEIAKYDALPKYLYFVVELYEDDFQSEPVMRRTTGALRKGDGSAAIDLTVPVHAGKYRLAAFAAACYDIDSDGCMYDLTDLGNVVFKDEYEGSTELKECYALNMDIDLELPEGTWFAEQTVTGRMESPLGRLEIISEDVADFVTRIGERSSASESVMKGPEEDLWRQYGLQWVYSFYYPVGYNVMTGYPNKTEQNVSFDTDIYLINDSEVLMGYDYVFVNGEDIDINLSLVLYGSQSGEIINTYSGVNATVYKGRTTTVRGDFLTTSQGAGIGIDPGFDGDINIVIPD